MEGDCISCVGSKGNGPLQFNNPHGIAISKAKRQVFVADSLNYRVQVLHLDDLTFSHEFGSKGSEQGRFNYPYGVAIDSKGFVYITDSTNLRVQKFIHHDGQFISSFGTYNEGWWLNSSLASHLSHPSGITVDDKDHLYINNERSEYVSVYTVSGKYIHQFNKSYKNSTDSTYFHGIVCDNNGTIFVCCTLGNTIKLF